VEDGRDDEVAGFDQNRIGLIDQMVPGLEPDRRPGQTRPEVEAPGRARQEMGLRPQGVRDGHAALHEATDVVALSREEA